MSMEDEVVLLDFGPSPFGMRLRIALAEKGIKYEYKEQDLWNKSPLLLQTNPVHKKIPVLIHNGKSVCESLVALQYIDEIWSSKSPLFPSDPYLKSQARFWADFVDSKLLVCWSKFWRAKEGEDQKAEMKGLLDCLKLLEGELGDKPCFGGESLGFVDVALIPIYSWLSVFEKLGNVSIEAECPAFIAWVKKCSQKESVAKSLPDQDTVYDTVVQLRKKLGIDD